MGHGAWKRGSVNPAPRTAMQACTAAQTRRASTHLSQAREEVAREVRAATHAVDGVVVKRIKRVPVRWRNVGAHEAADRQAGVCQALALLLRDRSWDQREGTVGEGGRMRGREWRGSASHADVRGVDNKAHVRVDVGVSWACVGRMQASGARRNCPMSRGLQTSS
eukprot:366029-Chlamydomonas_euryale.AAC.3